MPEIEIFTGPNCTYCQKAKALLDRRGIVYSERDIAADAAQFEALRRRLPRAKAIPQIFVDGDHLGSYEDLRLLDETDGLGRLRGAA